VVVATDWWTAGRGSIGGFREGNGSGSLTLRKEGRFWAAFRLPTTKIKKKEGPLTTNKRFSRFKTFEFWMFDLQIPVQK
jgi:hypothetical protein